MYIDSLTATAPGRSSHQHKQEYRDNARTLLGQINEQRQPYWHSDAEAISVPALFILGEKTQGALPVVLRALAASVRGWKTTIITNAAHHMIRQEPVGTSAAVLEFLKLWRVGVALFHPADIARIDREEGVVDGEVAAGSCRSIARSAASSRDICKSSSIVISRSSISTCYC